MFGKEVQNNGNAEEQNCISLPGSKEEGADTKHTGRCLYNCSGKQELQIEKQQVELIVSF